MTRLFRAFAVACPLALAGAAADAATFNFTDQYRNPTNSFSMTSDGITMTVYGGYYGGGYGTVRTHQGYGLSVGYHMIDGHEVALFKFSEAVTLDSFRAGYVDRYDDYKIWAYNGGWSKIQYGDFGVSNTYGYNSNRATVYTAGSAATTAATWFAIGTDDWNDDFKIRKITVDRVPEVPLPAAGLMLLTALGALGLRRRKA